MKIIAKLVAAGVAPDLIAEVADALAEAARGALAAFREANAARQKKFRENKARSVTSRYGNVTPPLSRARESTLARESKMVSSSLRSEDLFTSVVSNDTTSPKPQKSKSATRLPRDFRPSEAMRAYAVKHGFTDREIDREGENIRDWSLSSKNGLKLDWDATWQGWIRRRADERAAAPQRNGHKLNGHARPMTARERDAKCIREALRSMGIGKQEEPDDDDDRGRTTIDGFATEFPGPSGGAAKPH